MQFTVKPNTQYRARLRLGFFEGFVSNDTIKSKLEAVGLVNVSCQGSGRDRWAFGTWPKDKHVMTVDLPDQIVEVVKV